MKDGEKSAQDLSSAVDLHQTVSHLRAKLVCKTVSELCLAQRANGPLFESLREAIKVEVVLAARKAHDLLVGTETVEVANAACPTWSTRNAAFAT